MSFAYQDDGVAFLRSQGRAILGDDPGLGKSRQALLAAEGRTLIVAPAMVLDGGSWSDEIARWRPDLDVTTVSYSSLCARQDRKVLPEPRPQYAGQWDTIICDEAHKLKGRKTNWTLAVKRLRTERLFLLTGTAIPNWAHELYMLLQLIHPGDRRFTSYWRWVGEWFQVNEEVIGRFNGRLRTRKAVGDLRPDRTWDEFQQANLEGRFLRRVRDDVLDLPPLTEQHLTIPMKPAQRRVYEDLRKDYLAVTESGVEIVAWTKASQVVKMAQVATSTGTAEPDDPNPASAKMDMLGELLSGNADQVLVLCYFKGSARQAHRVAQDAGRTSTLLMADASKDQRRRTVQAFQAGDIDVMVTTIELIKEGLNLYSANRVIFVEHSYVPSSNEQALRRVHRIGQERPVTAVHLWSAKSIDESMRELLLSKTDQQMKALPVARVLAMLDGRA